MSEFMIIVPIFNVEKYLPQALDSILSQSFPDWDALLVDDGATDGSADIAARYCRSDSRFSLIRQKNGGLGAARNAAIPKTKGKYIIFLDGDDMLCPGLLQKVHESTERLHEPDIICCRGLVQFPDGNPAATVTRQFPEIPGGVMSGVEAFRWLVHHREYIPIASVWTRCYRRDLLQSGELFFLAGRLHEDEEWTPRTFFHAATVGFSDTCSILYRTRPGSIMHSNQEARIGSMVDNIIDMTSFLNSRTFVNQDDASAFMDDILFQYASFLLRADYTLKDKASALRLRKEKKIARLLKGSQYFRRKSKLGSFLYLTVRMIECLPFTLSCFHLAYRLRARSA